MAAYLVPFTPGTSIADLGTVSDSTVLTVDFVRLAGDTGTAGDGHVYDHQYPVNPAESRPASEATLINYTAVRIPGDTVTPSEGVALSRPPSAGAGLILYPINASSRTLLWSVEPVGTVPYTALTDGNTATYLYTATTGSYFTIPFESVLLPVCSPHRIIGLNVRFQAKMTATSASVVACFWLNGILYSDSNSISLDGTFRWKNAFVPVSLASFRRWTSNDLRYDFEAGLLATIVGAGQVQVAELSVSVAVEPMPTRVPLFNDMGKYSTLSIVPSTGTAIDAVKLDNGDLSYLAGNSNVKTTFRTDGDTIALPDEFQIDKISLLARAKRGTIRPLVREDGIDYYGPLGSWEEVCSDNYQSYYYPFPHRPNFPTGSSRWSVDTIKNAEYGFQATGIRASNISHVLLEVFASLRPESTKKYTPTSAGTYNDWSILAPGVGEQRYEDVNTYLPDDTSYLGADATLLPKWQTFTITNTDSANWYGVRLRARFMSEVGYTGSSTIQFVIIKNSRVYVGRKFVITNQTDWAELADDFWLNPRTGKPWDLTDLQSIQIGIVLTSGKLYCSWCNFDVGIVPPRVHYADSWVCEFTDAALAIIGRCTTDHVVWEVDKFQVGSGGFQYDNPAVVRPIEPSDSTLEQPIWMGNVAKASFSGFVATYWCPVPPNAFSEPIGEAMLWARIISSDVPGDVPGSYFPFAVAHFPCGFHTQRSIRVLKLTVTFHSPIVISEIVFVGDGVVVNYDAVRLATGTGTAGDSVTKYANYVRTSGDSGAAGDSLVEVDTYSIVAGDDAGAAGDAVVRTNDVERLAVDTVTVGDDVYSFIPPIRDEAGPALDLVVKEAASERVVGDSEAVGDGVLVDHQFPVYPADGGTAGDGSVRETTSERLASDGGTVSDGVVKVATSTRAKGDTGTAGDLAKKYDTASRKAAETITIDDNLDLLKY